ncbi:MAG: glutathione S-transferase family protein [Alphaproteobacteria bacterium]|nr:glutathione S-transferase family protein [Alphaproteobacteria bacterium]
MAAAPEGITLFIGSKDWSSWSLRPWLVLKVFDIPFTEELVPLRRPESKATLRALSPSGLVPALRHGSLTIWDSLAIIEYLADRFPDRRIWPAGIEARARARSLSAEMHAGFARLRQLMPMAFSSTGLSPETRDDALEADIARVVTLWSEALARRPEAEGPFLFGAFSAADAMYAPVVSRFRTYGVDPGGRGRDYTEAVWSLPAMAAWHAGALAERQARAGEGLT